MGACWEWDGNNNHAANAPGILIVVAGPRIIDRCDGTCHDFDMGDR